MIGGVPNLGVVDLQENMKKQVVRNEPKMVTDHMITISNPRICAMCRQQITGRCITAMFRKFHPECFVCRSDQGLSSLAFTIFLLSAFASNS